VAAGEPLPFNSGEISPRGHALECRVYAEDPDNNFFPSPGKIIARRIPAGLGIRLDDGVYPGWTVPNEYDPLLGKLIAWGNSREESIARMRRALQEYYVSGIKTNISLFRRILANPDFLAGRFHTGWLDDFLKSPANAVASGKAASEDAAVLAAALWHLSSNGAQSQAKPTEAPSRWKLEGRNAQLDRTPKR
jgi:acetyl-CoA carboxylase biotin carboxylase subunit